MRWFNSAARALLALPCVLDHAVFSAQAITLDPKNSAQVKDVAKKLAKQLVGQYALDTSSPATPAKIKSGEVGILPYNTKDEYFWWLAGGMFGTLIDYWYYTGDSTYNQLVIEGMMNQIGEGKDFLPKKWEFDIGNDDQLFWGFAAMSAAELGFPDPPDGQPGWLALAQAVMNKMIYHLNNDPPACQGGQRWQNKFLKPGFDYKNTAANGGTIQLGYRLAKYTGNKTYAEYAEKVYDWLFDSPVIGDDYMVNDGTDTKKNCIDADQTQWTYNYGLLISGCAYAYAYTNDTKWVDRMQKYLNKTEQWFPSDLKGVMYERCERSEVSAQAKPCNGDQFSFKAYFTRWLTVSMQLVENKAVTDYIMGKLTTSAIAAARVCDGPDNACGSRWYQDTFDDRNNVGSQMSALSVIQSLLYVDRPKPITADTGGTSKGDPSAGTQAPSQDPEFRAITGADRAGAAIITIMVTALLFGGAYWMVTGL